MRAAGRKHERPAWGQAEQPSLGIERVEKRVEVVLARPAPVEEDERSLRVAGRRPDEVLEAHETGALRGSGSGVSVRSTCSRYCSKLGGSERRSPSDSSGSSDVKPGPRVAISNSTPLGSRK